VRYEILREFLKPLRLTVRAAALEDKISTFNIAELP
jgi:hypothetical protein